MTNVKLITFNPTQPRMIIHRHKNMNDSTHINATDSTNPVRSIRFFSATDFNEN